MFVSTDPPPITTLLVSVYTEHRSQLCNDAIDIVVIESNGVTPDWSCNLFWSDFIVFNQNSIASAITSPTLTLSVNRPIRYIHIE